MLHVEVLVEHDALHSAADQTKTGLVAEHQVRHALQQEALSSMHCRTTTNIGRATHEDLALGDSLDVNKLRVEVGLGKVFHTLQ